MIPGVFNRLFGLYREGAILPGKWTLGASGAVTAQGSQTHRDLVLTKQVAAGTYTVSVRKGVRRMQVLEARYVNVGSPTTAADLRDVHITGAFLPASTGCGLVVVDGVTNAIEEGASGDEIHVTVMVDR